MKMSKILFCLMCSVFLIQSIQADEITKEFPARPGQRLKVDAEIGAAIVVDGWEDAKIRVVVKSDDQTDDFDAKFITDESGLRIQFENLDRDRYRNSAHVRCEIRVPSQFDVDVETHGGAIRLAGLEGEFTGKTMGGNLYFEDLNGVMEMKTMGGNVQVFDSQLEGFVKTMGGNITFTNVSGGIDGKTMGGSVKYKNSTGGMQKNTTTNEVKVTSMGGDINVADAPAGAVVKTYGGDIHIKYAGSHAKATTYGGDILIEEVGGWVEAKTYGGDVDVKVVGDPGSADQHIELVSYGGEIELTVPRNMDMDVDIELAYTRNSRGTFRIESDVELELTKTDDWEREHGSRRKYLYGRGKVGSGKNRVVIRTVNGNVILNSN